MSSEIALSQTSSEGILVTPPMATPLEQHEPTVTVSNQSTMSQTPDETKAVPPTGGGTCDDQNHRDIVATHQVTTAWGNGKNGWGEGEDTERLWTGLQSPKIVSLTVGWSWSDGPDDGAFRWRTSTNTGNPSHCNIVRYARCDLHAVLKPLGNTGSSILKEAPSDKWARTMIIRSLPEAQQASIPGPQFTLAEVRECLSQVNADIAAAQAIISENLARVDDIKCEQEPLQA
ncbi:hypothetical protein PQX77_013992 [Marasmius sp. AFHP31]|nr:hypothetical protein PQX77_013992 [Marasmius sp. AFHP31]